MHIHAVTSMQSDILLAINFVFFLGFDLYLYLDEICCVLQEDAKCEICKYIIQLLNEAVGKNASIAQVNNTLYEICSYLPDNIKNLVQYMI